MLTLAQDDISKFRSWLCLNLDSVTWQGRFKAEFEEFWTLFFESEKNLADLIDRFEYAKILLKIGPLVSWFEWLKNKLIVYVFIHKGLTIGEISEQTKISPGEIGHLLRSFFIEYFPRFDDELSDLFQISNIASSNFTVNIESVCSAIPIQTELLGSYDDEIMPSMEVTLYEEWGIFLERLKKDQREPRLSSAFIKSRMTISYQWNFFRDVFVLLFIAAIAVFFIQKMNSIYEKFLVEKISIYEPQFQWLDRTLIFKSNEEPLMSAEFNLDVDDLSEVVDVAGNFGIVEDEERFDPESEVTLTSWDSLPRDFNTASLEVSSFEELASGGYRDTRFGNTKVYRVMMKSVDTNKVRDQLEVLLNNYRVTQADNVKPGLNVPGGVYYNLFVPLEHLKEFIAQVMEVDDAILYESRTRAGRNPVGMNKVFIWVKSI